LPFIELEEERDAADRVKRDSPILVIIGNPPYNAFAGVSPKEEEGLVEPYKSGLNSEWNVKKFNLDELYVRFFRVAERRITERTGRGIICYITSYSYLTEPSFVVLRKRLLEGFDTLWFDCLNGDSRETGKISPDGTPDPSVFSTDLNREGIRLGTAIGLTIRKGKREGPSSVHYREFWGINKRTDLLGNLNLSASPNPYKTVIPTKANRFIFQSSKVAPEYLTWPRLTDLSSIDPITGYKENRGFSLLADEKKALIERMTRYYNKTITWAVLQKDNNGLTRDAARFDAKKTRAKILELEEFSPERLHPYILRPFEMKWCYYTSVRSLWNEPRPALYQHQFPGNRFFVSRPSGVSSPEGPPFYFHSCLGDFDFIRGHAYHFPIRLRPIASTGGKPIPSNQGSLGGDLESTSQSAQPNFSSDSTSYLRNLSGQSSSDFNVKAEWLWLHALAIGYSPLYLSENADGIRMDWPRIPLPNSEKALLLSVDLGRQIADLLDERTDIKGVTVNGARPELSALAVISNTRSGALNEAAGDLSLTAGWGHTSENRITMPGRGKVVERDYSRNELDLMHKRAATTGSNIGQLQALLGKSTCDIYLNDHAYWGNVPMKVWDYNIGGYQVLKKWLSYRESSTLGRPLSLDEVRGFMNVARRIAAIILLQPDLDKNYIQTKSNCYDWNVST
jgi:predicted helicase